MCRCRRHWDKTAKCTCRKDCTFSHDRPPGADFDDAIDGE